MGIVKRMGSTFLLGGMTGILGQIVLVACAAAGLEGIALPMTVLFVLGIIGCALVLAKVSDRLVASGSSVAFIAFFGMSIAMADAYRSVREAGGSRVAAFATTWRFFAMALVPGIVVAVGCGVIWALLA